MQFIMLNINIILALISSLSHAAPNVESPVLQKRILPVVLGVAKTYGAIGGSGLTCTGNGAISCAGGLGDIGTYPGTSITGFPPCTRSGTTQAGTVLAQSAEAACSAAYNNGLSITPKTALLYSDYAGKTLTKGVYTIPTLAGLISAGGILTLDGGGNSKNQFIFIFDTTFTIGAGAIINLVNGAVPCNVYFLAGTAITFNANAVTAGNFIAQSSISVANAVQNKGTLCAINGALTLINDALIAQCGTCPT